MRSMPASTRLKIILELKMVESRRENDANFLRKCEFCELRICGFAIIFATFA